MKECDVIIVGGGASGTALIYALSRYTDIPRIALFEKYPELGTVNSRATNNSQTLHVGDIETNYSEEKVREVMPAAMMVKRFADMLPAADRDSVIRKVQKMVIGIGAEIPLLRKRYEFLKPLFPELSFLDAEGIRAVEPAVVEGRKGDVAALFNPGGYAVDYGILARLFAREAVKRDGVSVHTGTKVLDISARGSGYIVRTAAETWTARAVVVDADAYSLLFAKRMGYGRQFSLIPVAGSFYFTKKVLNGKVYTVQDTRMPFAAVHGDPDLTAPGTRWGPTARFYAVMEARKLTSALSFFAASGLHRPATWVSFLVILMSPVRFWYLLKNFFYDLPFVGRYFFVPEVRKIVPTIKAADLVWTPSYGGMRLQRVDTERHEMLLGEGKIVGEGIIFNMTPSPGASVSLYNAMRDAEALERFFKGAYRFEKDRFLNDFGTSPDTGDGDVSLKDTYAA